MSRPNTMIEAVGNETKTECGPPIPLCYWHRCYLLLALSVNAIAGSGYCSILGLVARRAPLPPSPQQAPIISSASLYPPSGCPSGCHSREYVTVEVGHPSQLMFRECGPILPFGRLRAMDGRVDNLHMYTWTSSFHYSKSIQSRLYVPHALADSPMMHTGQSFIVK